MCFIITDTKDVLVLIFYPSTKGHYTGCYYTVAIKVREVFYPAWYTSCAFHWVLLKLNIYCCWHATLKQSNIILIIAYTANGDHKDKREILCESCPTVHMIYKTALLSPGQTGFWAALWHWMFWSSKSRTCYYRINWSAPKFGTI